MQSLEPILIFTTVAEMTSFTRAADSLGIQKGRASMAVRRLEEEIGARLLHRTTRSVQLTDDGRAFHALARDLLADIEDLHSMFTSDRVPLRGSPRVDLPTEVARTTIVPALPDFMAAPPELELELSSSDRQVDLVQEGFDRVLRLGSIGDETLIARPLGKLRIINAASPAYLARCGVPQPQADLMRQHHRTIHFETTLDARPFEWEIPERRKLRDTSVAGRAARQQRTNLRNGCPRRSRRDSSAPPWDWAQPVTPSPRVQDVDRKCTRANSVRKASLSGNANLMSARHERARC